MWPCLTDLMPWQHSGTQAKRTWPIAPDTDTLERRWSALLQAKDRAAAFREDPDRRAEREYTVSLGERSDPKPIAELPLGAPMPEAQRSAYRSFDRQYLVVDSRLVSYLRPPLWHSQGGSQIFLTGLLTRPLAPGPALTATALVPDLHHFSGRGGKDAIPLYRTADTTEPNLTPGLLALLSSRYGRKVDALAFAAYSYGILAHPTFAEQFSAHLDARVIRVPITKDGTLFERVRSCGAKLLWLHTYGERCVPVGEQASRVHPGGRSLHAADTGRPASLSRELRLRRPKRIPPRRIRDHRAGSRRGLRLQGLGLERGAILADLPHGSGRRTKILRFGPDPSAALVRRVHERAA